MGISSFFQQLLQILYYFVSKKQTQAFSQLCFHLLCAGELQITFIHNRNSSNSFPKPPKNAAKFNFYATLQIFLQQTFVRYLLEKFHLTSKTTYKPYLSRYILIKFLRLKTTEANLCLIVIMTPKNGDWFCW